MKTIVILLFCLSVSQGMNFSEFLLDEWHLFKKTYSKHYKNEIEEGFRKDIFLENYLKIAAHNAKADKNGYHLAMNPFGDLLHQEFVGKTKGFDITSGKIKIGQFNPSPSHVQIPESVNWIDQGAVSYVKFEGACGASCGEFILDGSNQAFGATGSIEGQIFRKYGKLVPLSEQNLIDCSSKYGNKGCKGGSAKNAYLYVKANHGIDTEKSYPTRMLRSRPGRCHYKRKYKGAEIKGFVQLPPGNEAKLKEAVATVGPISVAFDSSHPSFQFYSRGVYDEKDCSPSNLTYGAVIVGYGTNEDGEEYWLVKCSLTFFWGEYGYIRIARGRNNTCGIATSPSYPLV